MVMTTASPRLADLTREEADTLTEQIKENFDSLGNMLLAARDRKAYKALGYRSFETYCQTEFGKSSSTAYRAIEDAKVRTQLEAHVSENYGHEMTFNFPSSHLRPLKAVEGLDNKLKALEYAQKLAEGEGRKATKQHLEIAVFELSGKRSEDFRSAIQKLGFTQGTQVETISPAKKERGIVKKVDKLGKIHIELFYGSNKPIECNATQLRILNNEEKPANPLEGSIASKGDRVLIYAQGLQGKKGTIYSWKEGKTALVKIDERENDSPIVVAYAEMELLKTESKNATWESDLVWNSGKNTYYYFPQEKRITSNLWPIGLYLEPSALDTASGSPINLMHQWDRDFAGKILESLANPARTKTLALAQAIELPEAEGKEFATDLITSLSQLFPQVSSRPKAMGISFSRTINELISGKKTQTRRTWQDDYAKNFIRYFEENIAIPALDKGRHRGGRELGFVKLTQRPYQQYLSEMTATDLQEEGDMVATTQEFIDTFFEGQDKLVWVLHFEFLSTPISSNTDDEVIAENQRLREQLAEAEVAIQTMVNAAKAFRETTTTKLLPKITNPSKPTLPDKIEAQIGLLVRRFEDEYIDVEPYQIIEIEGEKVNCLKAGGFTEWIHERNLRVIVDQPMISELLARDTTELPPKTVEQTAKSLVEDTASIDSVLGAEQTTEFLVEDADSTDSVVDTAAHSDFLLGNTSETATPGDTAAHSDILTAFLEENAVATPEESDWRSVLASNDFTPLHEFWCVGEVTETYRDWQIYLDAPNGAVNAIDLNHSQKGSFCRSTHDLEDSYILEFAKDVINQVEDFRPGQLSLFSAKPNTEGYFPVEIADEIPEFQAKFQADIKKIEHQLKTGIPARESKKNLTSKLQRLKGSLEKLDDVQKLTIGQTVRHKSHPEDIGRIARITLSTGGMPEIFVQWPSETGEKNYIPEKVELLLTDKAD